MEKIKYALIGCGRISPNHITAISDNSGEIEIVGICDIVPENMERFGLDASIKRYTDYKLMLAEQKPQLVAIATESGNHAKIALDAIESLANVIIEKPIALSLSDADDIINLAEEKGVLVCACHQNRFNKSILKIREAVENGDFGKLFHATAHIRWCRDENYYIQAPWRGTWEQDGGALMNQCIHNIDLLRWMMGDEIQEVVAFTDNLNHDYIQAEDLGLALIKFKNGGYGTIEGTTNVYPSNLEETLYIFGEKGTVKAGGKSVNTIEEWRFANSDESVEDIKRKNDENPENVYGFGHSRLYKNVIDAINHKTPLYVDGKAGKRALELVLAIYKSAQEGRIVKLPLDSASTLDFEGRFN